MMRTFVHMICVGSLFALSAKAIDPIDVKAAIAAMGYSIHTDSSASA